MKINLGNTQIDVQSLATQASSILGIRGGGKTYTAIKICEDLLELGIPFTAVDPSGVWKNIKVSNGTPNGKGYDVIVIGGENPDIDINEDFNNDEIVNIVEIAVRNNASFIFDLYRSKISREKWGEILTLAFKTLYQINSGIRLIFLEEAATFIPQNQKAFSKELYSIIEEITRIGGNSQLGMVFVSQRAEQLNKQCLDLCDLMILHRQRGNSSLKTIKKWLDMGVGAEEMNKEVLNSLPTLESGECWVLEKESSVPCKTKVPQKKSFHPDRKNVSEDYLKSSLDVNIESVLSSMKSSGAKTQVKPFTYSLPSFKIETPETKEVEIFTGWESLGSDWYSRKDYSIMQQANNTQYGTSTVKNSIDNLVRKGYTRFISDGCGFGRLECGNRSYTLHTKLECSYAELLIRKTEL